MLFTGAPARITLVISVPLPKHDCDVMVTVAPPFTLNPAVTTGILAVSFIRQHINPVTLVDDARPHEVGPMYVLSVLQIPLVHVVVSHPVPQQADCEQSGTSVNDAPEAHRLYVPSPKL